MEFLLQHLHLHGFWSCYISTRHNSHLADSWSCAFILLSGPTVQRQGRKRNTRTLHQKDSYVSYASLIFFNMSNKTLLFTSQRQLASSLVLLGSSLVRLGSSVPTADPVSLIRLYSVTTQTSHPGFQQDHLL